MTDREDLRKALKLVKDRLGSLDWVSRDAGITPLHRIVKYLDGDDTAFSNEEVKFLLDWYYFAGPT